MSFDWTEYLGLAKELAGYGKTPASEEARLRSTVSRAYYAAFGVARNTSRHQEGIALPRGDVHKYVWDQFKRSSNPVRKEIGAYGDRLKKDRVKADYDDTIAGLPSLAWKALTHSSLVIERLRRL